MKEYIIKVNESDLTPSEKMCLKDYHPTALVRCKGCKWWDKKQDSPYGYCHACKHGHRSEHWEIGIYRTYKGDWFCADGEEKENAD